MNNENSPLGWAKVAIVFLAFCAAILFAALSFHGVGHPVTDILAKQFIYICYFIGFIKLVLVLSGVIGGGMFVMLVIVCAIMWLIVEFPKVLYRWLN